MGIGPEEKNSRKQANPDPVPRTKPTQRDSEEITKLVVFKEQGALDAVELAAYQELKNRCHKILEEGDRLRLAQNLEETSLTENTILFEQGGYADIHTYTRKVIPRLSGFVRYGVTLNTPIIRGEVDATIGALAEKHEQERLLDSTPTQDAEDADLVELLKKNAAAEDFARDTSGAAYHTRPDSQRIFVSLVANPSPIKDELYLRIKWSPNESHFRYVLNLLDDSVTVREENLDSGEEHRDIRRAIQRSDLALLHRAISLVLPRRTRDDTLRQ